MEEEFLKIETSSEIDSMWKNKPWVLMSGSKARKVLSNKCITCKMDSVTEIAVQMWKYKSCLVTRGFQQPEGMDYEEILAPVAKFTTLSLCFFI